MAAAIGGDASAMRATSTIAPHLAASPIHSSLTAALTQAGLAETLSGADSFTPFAPTAARFAPVPPLTRAGWMRPAPRALRPRVRTPLIVPGRRPTPHHPP